MTYLLVVLGLLVALMLVVTIYLWDRIVFLTDVAEDQLGEIRWYRNAIRRAASVDRLRDDLEAHEVSAKRKLDAELRRARGGRA